MDTIKSLFLKGKYDEIIAQNLQQVKNMSTSGTVAENDKKLEKLYYMLVSCEQNGYYCDYLDVLKKFNEIHPIKCMKDKKVCLMILSFAIEALIYCLFNNEIENLGIKYDIKDRIEKFIKLQDNILQGCNESYSNRQKELRDLYEDYKNGRMPIYTVEYLYPFEPIVKDYTFNLSQCYPYISLTVKKVSRDNDNYTSFKFKAYGFIKPDIFWKGAKWETREKMPPIKKSLDIVNMLLLQAVKASPGKMVLPYSINQVSTASMFQYRYDEKEPILGGTIIGTDFSSQWVGGNAVWHVFTDEEMIELNKLIVQTYKNKSFVATFHHATNLFSAGFNLEAFTLICFCCEGMMYHWFGELAKISGIENDYIKYRQSKESKCDTCKYFDSSSGNKPYAGMVPSMFSNIKFLCSKKCISCNEMKTIQKLFSKVRNDNLRNKIAHGEENKISHDIVQKSLDSLMELQSFLVNIVDKKRQEINKNK